MEKLFHNISYCWYLITVWILFSSQIYFVRGSANVQKSEESRSEPAVQSDTAFSATRDNEIKSPLCHLPTEWHGDWHRDDLHTGRTALMTINETSISTIGSCEKLINDTKGDSKQYYILIVSDPLANSICWKCVLVFERHRNILQYRMSDGCADDENTACEQILPDTYVYIMFRANATPEKCPIEGPATFSYSNAESRCDTNTSTIAGCVDKSRLRLNYIACPNTKMQSRTDEFSCIGQFQLELKIFFVAKLVNRQTVLSEGDLHRCFVYNKTSVGGQLKISADPTCRALQDVKEEHDVTLYYTQRMPPPKDNTCTFRSFLRHKRHMRGDGNKWESLSRAGTRHVFDINTWSIYSTARKNRASGESLSMSTCVTEEPKDNKSVRMTVFTESGCDSGYQCVEFFRHPTSHRRNEIMDVQIGKMAPTSQAACDPEYFDPKTLIFETLLNEDSREIECPTEHRGHYLIRGCEASSAAFFIGCDSKHHTIIHQDCIEGSIATYYCFGDWADTDNPNVHYLAIEDAASGRKTCFAYANDSENKALALSTFRHHSCQRGILPGINGHRTFNLTKPSICDITHPVIVNMTQNEARATYHNHNHPSPANSLNGIGENLRASVLMVTVTIFACIFLR